MMSSNLLSRFRSTTEPAAASIYETIRQHDYDSDTSDLEERAGLALDQRNLEEDFRDFDPNDAPSESSHAMMQASHTNRILARSGSTNFRESRRQSSRRKMQRRNELTNVEEGDDDVPASLLIEESDRVLPHEIPNLPLPPHETSPNLAADEQAQEQWAQAPNTQGAPSSTRDVPRRRAAGITPAFTAFAMADPKEKAMYRWINVEDLDTFLAQVYDYYLHHGFWSILLSRFLNLLTGAFIVSFFLFLTQCINYKSIKGSSSMPEILVPQCTSRMGFFPNLLLWLSIFIWLFRVFISVIDIQRLIHLRDFYHFLLGVPEEEIQSISWQEIVSRLMALRDSNPNIATSTSAKSHRFLGTQNKQRMDAHDIANRLMRKDNYMVAMINKDILDMTLPIPGLRNKQLFTKTLEWNIDQCIMDYVFNSKGQIRQLFLKDTHRRALSEGLKRRFIFAGTVNLIFAPFLISYFLLQNFFQYFNEYQKNPAQIGARHYNVLAQWKFREFNELWHLFQRRLNMSYPFATRYINQFPKDKTVQAARFVTFVSGAIVSVLGLATVLDQENFLGFEITSGRTTIFYLGVFGSIWAVARGMLPDDNEVYDSSYSMEEVIDFTHYRPAHWEGRLHTVEVKTEFARLYQIQIAILVEEVLSMVFTPFVLWFSLPKCSDQIIDFFREFTVHVDGVGYVCSFAEFNFRKPGNTIPSSNNTRAKGPATGLRDDYFATKDQKLEQSYWGFMNDYARNPKTDVRYPYREGNASRRRFNMPPPFPGLLSPPLNPSSNTIDNTNTTMITARQSHMFSPRRAMGFQPTTPKFAGQTPSSPLQSILLDPHHLPLNASHLAIGSPQALRPRNTGKTSILRQSRSNQDPAGLKGRSGLQREETINTTISENPDNPPAELTGVGDNDGHVSAQASQGQFSQQEANADMKSQVFGSWNKPEDDSHEDTEDEDDVAALTGEGAGVLGLIRQFQRAQGEGTRTGGVSGI